MMGLNMEEEAEEILMTGGKIELILRKCFWFIWAEQSPTLQTHLMNGSWEQNNLLPYRHIWWILKLGSAWISVSLVCLEIHQTCHWCDQISCGFSEWVCKHKVQVHVCSELQSMQVYNCIRENEDNSQTCCNKSLSGLNKYDVVTLRLWLSEPNLSDWLTETFVERDLRPPALVRRSRTVVWLSSLQLSVK